MLNRFRNWFIERLSDDIEVARQLWYSRDGAQSTLDGFIESISRYWIFGVAFVFYVFAPVITVLVFLG